ncbi:MAG: MarC family protein [Schleiferiaceae bacterium]
MDLISTFIFLFAVIDPVGSIPVFIAVTQGFDKKQKKAIAIRATVVATIVLLFFIVAGEPLLDAIQVPLPSFQIAGGIVLFMFAMSMIFGESKPESEINTIKEVNEKAIFPLAIPSIASPGAMLAVVLLTKNEDHPISEQAITSLVMLSVLIIVVVFLLMASRIQKLIGESGASLISRIMGLILSSIAVSNVVEGIKASFDIL